jgi:hypothetical protein
MMDGESYSVYQCISHIKDGATAHRIGIAILSLLARGLLVVRVPFLSTCPKRTGEAIDGAY